MSHEATIHTVQTIILRSLLFKKSATFSELQKISDLDSDHFKFHLKRLVDLEYVDKKDVGYSLSVRGKEYANKLDTDNNEIERQPKSAVILVIEKTEDGVKKYLVQERLKHPFYGFWGFASGKVRWGETILHTAKRELVEETGLSGNFTHRGIYHEQVLQEHTDTIIEDKIFHIMFSDNTNGVLKYEFEGGRNAWMTMPEIRLKEKRYKSFDVEASIGLESIPFTESTQIYSDDQF